MFNDVFYNLTVYADKQGSLLENAADDTDSIGRSRTFNVDRLAHEFGIGKLSILSYRHMQFNYQYSSLTLYTVYITNICATLIHLYNNYNYL